MVGNTKDNLSKVRIATTIALYLGVERMRGKTLVLICSARFKVSDDVVALYQRAIEVKNVEVEPQSMELGSVATCNFPVSAKLELFTTQLHTPVALMLVYFYCCSSSLSFFSFFSISISMTNILASTIHPTQVHRFDMSLISDIAIDSDLIFCSFDQI